MNNEKAVKKFEFEKKITQILVGSEGRIDVLKDAYLQLSSNEEYHLFSSCEKFSLFESEINEYGQHLLTSDEISNLLRYIKGHLGQF